MENNLSDSVRTLRLSRGSKRFDLNFTHERKIIINTNCLLRPFMSLGLLKLIKLKAKSGRKIK